jgi:hypothetical protein
LVRLGLFRQGSEQLANGIVTTEASGGEWGIAFAQCEHVCAPIDQELDHFRVPLHARNMQGRITEIARLVDVDASVNESLAFTSEKSIAAKSAVLRNRANTASS